MLKSCKRDFLLIAIVSALIIGLTYSRLVNKGIIHLYTNVASWSVKINGQDVNSSSSFTLDNIVWENANVANGYVAPGGKGYYEIKIDTTGTKVAVDYAIQFHSEELEENTRMKVEKVTFDDAEIESVDGSYRGFISLDDVLSNKVITIKIYITWDESKNSHEDTLDLQSVLTHKKVKLPMFVTVRQHITSENLGANLVPQLLSYEESLEKVSRPTTVIVNPSYNADLDALYQNPERGFYNTNYLILSKSGNSIKNMESKVSRLLYLKVDLSSFSAWRNGTDIELTPDAINTLRAQLENIKQNNNTVILRFVYDNNATGIYNDNKTKFEPQQETLIRHIQQLSSVFQEYSTTIYTIQVGFYGLWGESYYNTDVNSHPTYYRETMEALLDATKGTEITIAFRTPGYVRSAMNGSKYDASRVGVFNDAYLSQSDDMGTFTNRKNDVAWLNLRNTSYGGEALPATSDSSWDLVKNTEAEMFLTHTSYLNFEWNQNKHYTWANQTYDGKDTLYYGKTTALEYIQNHLGYRFVLRKVELPESANSGTEIGANITIENVGFGNVLKSKTSTLLFVDSSDKVKGSLNITGQLDIKNFQSTKSIEENLIFYLPDLASGNYRVFLRISNEKLNNGTYYNAIRFANEGVWNDSLQANHIGNITIN